MKRQQPTSASRTRHARLRLERLEDRDAPDDLFGVINGAFFGQSVFDWDGGILRERVELPSTRVPALGVIWSADAGTDHPLPFAEARHDLTWATPLDTQPERELTAPADGLLVPFDLFPDPLGRDDSHQAAHVPIADNHPPENTGATTMETTPASNPTTTDNIRTAADAGQSVSSAPVLSGEVADSSGAEPPATDGALVPMASTAGTALASTAPTARPRYGQNNRLYFEPNLGQSSSAVRYLSRGKGYKLFLTASETVLTLQRPIPPLGGPPQRSVLRLQLVGANPQPLTQGLEALTGRSHYIRGRDALQWRQNVPRYGKVNFANIYPGVDAVYYGTSQRQVEFDYVVAPGASPTVIRLAIQGATSRRLDAQGHLILSTASGDVIQRAPLMYQLQGTSRQPVAGRYLLLADNQVGFEVQGGYDLSRPLYIDPVLDYSVAIDGNGEDTGEAIAVEADGTAYVTGETTSDDLPEAGSTTYAGNRDAYVTKVARILRGLPMVTITRMLLSVTFCAAHFACFGEGFLGIPSHGESAHGTSLTAQTYIRLNFDPLPERAMQVPGLLALVGRLTGCHKAKRVDCWQCVYQNGPGNWKAARRSPSSRWCFVCRWQPIGDHRDDPESRVASSPNQAIQDRKGRPGV